MFPLSQIISKFVLNQNPLDFTVFQTKSSLQVLFTGNKGRVMFISWNVFTAHLCTQSFGVKVGFAVVCSSLKPQKCLASLPDAGSSVEEMEFNWDEYLEDTGAIAAPHGSFKHVSKGACVCLTSPAFSLIQSV